MAQIHLLEAGATTYPQQRVDRSESPSRIAPDSCGWILGAGCLIERSSVAFSSTLLYLAQRATRIRSLAPERRTRRALRDSTRAIAGALALIAAICFLRDLRRAISASI